MYVYLLIYNQPFTTSKQRYNGYVSLKNNFRTEASMGKDKNQNPQQMGNKGNFQQKQPQPHGKENINPGQRPQTQTDRLNTQKPIGGGHMGGQQQNIKKESWKDKDK